MDFGQLPHELLIELVGSLQVLNTSLISENNGLKQENIQLDKLVRVLEERIAVLETAIRTLQGSPHLMGLIEKTLPKFHEKLMNGLATNVSPALVELGMKKQASAGAKKARGARTADDDKVKAKAFELYDAGNWKSTADAARTIFPAVNEFASTLNRTSHKKVRTLSAERFRQTLGSWLLQRAKKQEK